MQPILTGKANVVYGSRFAGSGLHQALFFWHMVGNRFLTLLSNMVTNLKVDVEFTKSAFHIKYHDNWLYNLCISASFGGYRSTP